VAVKTLSKALFLEELAKGKGVKAICKDYGMKTTSTIYTWRTRDKEFKKQYDKIMSSPHHKARIASHTTKKVAEEGWRERFVHKMIETGDRVMAADYAGKTMKYIMDAADPSHEDYDEKFHDMLYEQELREAVQIEDEVKRKALKENSVQMQKYLLPFLPVVGEKYSRGKENRLEASETNVFIFNPQSMQAAERQIVDVFGSKSLPAPKSD
jgi:hypothetical protein